MARTGEKRPASTAQSHTSADNRGGKRKDQGVVNFESSAKDNLFDDLWHVCAGSLVYVPRTGDRVVYFPQGHLEQVQACTPHDGQVEVPNYNLPYKIICKVVSVNLKAEAHTDEVFAQVTLIPEGKEDEINSEECSDSLPHSSKTIFCSKTLTPSDISTHGGFSLPRRLAEDCLPPLDMSQDTPAQELVANDLHGFKWTFRHKYRGQPKRHLITSGWSTFVNTKKLVAGNTCIFLRGENGELRIGIRRAMKQQSGLPASILSGNSMHHGILASASHAISTGTRFMVYYRPWTSPSEFIIPYNLYKKSSKINYSIGMRLRMQVEAEECLKKRCRGTIVGIRDIDGAKWPSSEWKRIEVQWDASSDAFVAPEKVSHWNVEPIDFPAGMSISSNQPKKRDVYESPWQEVSTLAKGVQSSINHSPQICNTLPYHGNKHSSDDAQYEESSSLLPADLPLANPAYQTHARMENCMHILLNNPLQQCSPKLLSFLDKKTCNAGLPFQYPANIPNDAACDSVAVSRNVSLSKEVSVDSGSQKWGDTESGDVNEDPIPQPDGASKFRLFGVNLANSHQELPSPQIASSGKNSPPPAPTPQSSTAGNIEVSENSKSISGAIPERQCKKSDVTSRSCFKVLKHGSRLGRSIDFRRFHDYDELISELDQMFDFKGSLVDKTSGWLVTYTDNVGDTMLIGDCPWQDFLAVVQKMLVCPLEAFDKQNPD